MLNIYRVDHIGQIVPDLQRQAALMEGLFGFRRCREWQNAEQGCRGLLLDVPGSWGHRWEILAPLGEHSPLQEFLDSPLGPGIHHVAVQVPDMETAMKEIAQLGVETNAGPDDAWIDVAFAPPDGPQGLQLRVFAPPVLATCGDDGRPRPVPKRETMNGPSLGIVAIEQVGQAYPDRDVLADWCERSLGMKEVYRTPEGKHPDIATLVLTIPGTQMRWELIAPVDEESFVHRFVTKRGSAAHHVTFEVRDWEPAMAACEHHGVPTFDLNEGETDGARWRDIFIHPKHSGGFLVQLFWEERPGVWSRSDKIPKRG